MVSFLSLLIVMIVAPEVLNPDPKQRSYGKEVDMWSCGVILYICLCGFPPFSEELAPPSMPDQIKGGKYCFPSPAWDSISDEAIDLVVWLLTVDPEQRASVDDALAHDWMNMEMDDGIEAPFVNQLKRNFTRQQTYDETEFAKVMKKQRQESIAKMRRTDTMSTTGGMSEQLMQTSLNAKRPNESQTESQEPRRSSRRKLNT